MKKNIVVFICLLMCTVLSACDISVTASINGETPTITEADESPLTENLTLQDRMFFGERNPVSLGGYNIDGTNFMWYYYTFGIPFHGLSSTFENIVGTEAVDAWMNTLRDENGTVWWGGMRNFIDYFGLTVEDFIAAEESVNGIPMEEADPIIIWARDIFERQDWDNSIDEDGNAARDWDFRLTTAEIKAFFSDCVYEIWEHFPGYGVVHNGNVYSPEWIIQNIGYAILEENIPVEEVERILERASNFPDLEMKVELAFEELGAALGVLDSR